MSNMTRFSLVRSLGAADFLTLANAASGVGAVLLSTARAASGNRAYLYAGAALLGLALLWDTLDGRVARSRGPRSGLGREMDSLADVISFGVAPAALAFAAGLNGAVGAAALLFYVGCGVCRLARYNATADELARQTGKVQYFEGAPITFGLAPLAVVIALDAIDRLHPPLTFASATLFVATGCAMVSRTIRVPKL